VVFRRVCGGQSLKTVGWVEACGADSWERLSGCGSEVGTQSSLWLVWHGPRHSSRGGARGMVQWCMHSRAPVTLLNCSTSTARANVCQSLASIPIPTQPQWPNNASRRLATPRRRTARLQPSTYGSSPLRIAYGLRATPPLHHPTMPSTNHHHRYSRSFCTAAATSSLS
jgi:hypothetical protein